MHREKGDKMIWAKSKNGASLLRSFRRHRRWEVKLEFFGAAKGGVLYLGGYLK